MIAIVKYNAGNVRSVQNALINLGYESIITDKKDTLQCAERVIFPGVGEASSAMFYLKEKGLDQVIINLKQPVLGICLGMQLMCQSSEEGEVETLGIFNSQVKKFPETDIVPQMGWNDFIKVEGPLFKGIDIRSDVYFVHSYYAEVCENTIAETDYILKFSSALRKDNFYGTQFHPEKSGKMGEQILKNFLEL